MHTFAVYMVCCALSVMQLRRTTFLEFASRHPILFPRLAYSTAPGPSADSDAGAPPGDSGGSGDNASEVDAGAPGGANVDADVDADNSAQAQVRGVARLRRTAASGSTQAAERS